MRENEGKKLWRERLDEKGRKIAEILGKNGEKDGGEKRWKEERKEGKDNREKKIEGRKKGGN